ncbi:hypothetical protein MXB_1632 [Myxobolus squamalis]|nr:hypothetical protein MXB_1632 [Myxobolus squamalis]
MIKWVIMVTCFENNHQLCIWRKPWFRYFQTQFFKGLYHILITNKKLRNSTFKWIQTHPKKKYFVYFVISIISFVCQLATGFSDIRLNIVVLLIIALTFYAMIW